MSETTFTHAQLSNSQQLHTILDDNEKIPFDTLVWDSEGITHKGDTFEITKEGTYLVSWGIAISGSDLEQFVKFALEVNGEKYSPSTSPATLGTLSSTDLITVTQTPTTISLTNVTGDKVSLANVQPVAKITITKVDYGKDTALNNLIYSIALEETALAHVLYAESEKILAALKIPSLTTKELLCINRSVENTIESISKLEIILSAKLKAALEATKKEC